MLRLCRLVYPLLILVLSLFLDTEASDYVFNQNAGMHYKFHPQGKKWYDANRTCSEEGAKLATPRTHEQAAVLVNIFSVFPHGKLSGIGNADLIFLGFHDLFLEGHFENLNDEPIQYFYQRWAHGQPNGGTGENCLVMDRHGQYHDNHCEHTLAFLCERGDLEPPVMMDEHCFTRDIGYEYASDLQKCYKLHAYPTFWSDARAICRAEGGHLAVIRNQKEEKYAIGMLERYQNLVQFDSKEYLLVGVTDQFEEGYFATEFNEPVDDIGYLRWKPGMPNGGAGENCGALWVGGGMDDFNCKRGAMFLCEIKAIDSMDVRFGNR